MYANVVLETRLFQVAVVFQVAVNDCTRILAKKSHDESAFESEAYASTITGTSIVNQSAWTFTSLIITTRYLSNDQRLSTCMAVVQLSGTGRAGSYLTTQ